MKSFHLLSKEQTARAGLLQGEATVLEPTTVRHLRDFFAREKASTVTIGALHPDPHAHVPNFGRDYLYFTTDAACAELEVAAQEAPVQCDGLRLDAYRCIKGGAMWRVEMICSVENQKRSLAHLYQPESQPVPLDDGAPMGLPAQSAPRGGFEAPQYTPLAFQTQSGMSVEVVPVELIRQVEDRLTEVERRLETVQGELNERTAERDAARQHVTEAEFAVLVLKDASEAKQAEQGNAIAQLKSNLSETITQARDAEVEVEKLKSEAVAQRGELEQWKERVDLLRLDVRIAGEKHAVEAAQLKKESEQLTEDLAGYYSCEHTIAKLKKDLDAARAKIHEAQAATQAQAVGYDSQLERVMRERDRVAHEVTLLKDRLKAKDYEIRLERRRVNTLDKDLKAQKALRDAPPALASKSRSRSAGTWRGSVRLPAEVTKEESVVKGLNRLLEKEREKGAGLERDVAARDEELKLLKERYNHAGLALVEMQEKEEAMARKFLEADAEHSAELTVVKGDLTRAEEELHALRPVVPHLRAVDCAGALPAPTPAMPSYLPAPTHTYLTEALLRLPTDRPDMIGVVSPPPQPPGRPNALPIVLSPPVHSSMRIPHGHPPVSPPVTAG
eukprot:TRINITY_DN27734_c0_g1_i1.p1 TRINITY_DN27734_c0_g1~~TRINITY_DN27734_c0_g1_i1.p1  ORF type:complete len:631 (+),score=281.72 TRINITY_DN27734_c0_g1_i1:46-1893(+)